VTPDTGAIINSAHVTDRRGAREILDFAEERVNAKDTGQKDAGRYHVKRENVSPGKDAGSKLNAGMIKPVSYDMRTWHGL
jgi:hypothetical protein